MVPPKVLHKLALVLAHRVLRPEMQNATRPDKIQDVNLTSEPLTGLLVHCHSLLSLEEPGAIFDAAAATSGDAAGADVLPVSER